MSSSQPEGGGQPRVKVDEVKTADLLASPPSKGPRSVLAPPGVERRSQLLSPGATAIDDDDVLEANITRRLSAVFEAIEEDKKDQVSSITFTY